MSNGRIERCSRSILEIASILRAARLAVRDFSRLTRVCALRLALVSGLLAFLRRVWLMFDELRLGDFARPGLFLFALDAVRQTNPVSPHHCGRKAQSSSPA